MYSRSAFTKAGDALRLYACFSAIFAVPGAMIGTVAGVAYFGPKGIFQSLLSDQPKSDIARESVKGIAKFAFFGATVYPRIPLTVPYAVYKVAETVKNRM